MSLGRKEIGPITGRPVTVSAGSDTVWKHIGVGYAWNKVSAAVSDTTLTDDTPIKVGEKYFRYGTVMVPVGTATVQTIEITGTPTGGSFSVAFKVDNVNYVTGDIAYNATADAVKEAFNTARPGTVSKVTLAGSTYTVTFAVSAHVVPEVVTADDFEGGTTPETVVTVTAAGDSDNGYWNEWNGSDDLVRGQVGILNQTIKQGNASVHQGYWDEETGGLIEGGTVWGERINVSEAELATLLEAMPLLRLAPKQ